MPTKNVYAEFAIIMKEHRMKKKVKQNQLARVVGVRAPTICKIEHEIIKPSLKIAVQIANYLGFSLKDIQKVMLL